MIRYKDRYYDLPTTLRINNITISAIWSQTMRNNRGFKAKGLFSYGLISLLIAIVVDKKYAVKMHVYGGCI
jgi:hypothetical protein